MLTAHEMAEAEQSIVAGPRPSLVNVTHLVYALHAVSLGVGALTTATVVGAFLFGWPSIIAVVLNYVYRADARGTWLESHFSWQIRTFWYSFAGSALIFAISVPLMLVLIGFAILPIGFFVLGVWAIYRIARGWLRLKDGRPIDA